MSLRRRFAFPTIAACLAAAALASFKLDGPTIGDGWLFDVALAARARLWPATTPETESKVVVVAIDQRSLESDKLAALPRVLFSPIWAELVTALGTAGAEVVAFDLLFAYDANSFRRGYNLPFL